jgi:hypothetical protein
MKEAAKALNVTPYKLAQLVNAGLIDTKENVRDKRAKLIDMDKAKQVLGIS